MSGRRGGYSNASIGWRSVIESRHRRTRAAASNDNAPPYCACVRVCRSDSIDIEGDSIATQLGRYLFQRLDGLTFAPKSPTSQRVMLDTLSIPHAVWMGTERDFSRKLQKRKNANSTNRLFWVGTNFIVSEREPGLRMARARRFTTLAEPILRAKGWQFLDAFFPSAAFAFDTSTQMDGIHIIGPPMKLLVKKLFHHLCLPLLK